MSTSEVAYATNSAAGPPKNVVTGIIKAIRPKQWVKNLLVLAAPIAALGAEVPYDYDEMAINILIAFVSFSMAAFFGPFIGAIPCLIILVVIDPWAALKFLIFIFALQQFDGNILGPKILGGSLGLPTLWIMFAIIVGGALFGVPGMVISVPIFSVLYILVRDWINAILKKKQINIE